MEKKDPNEILLTYYDITIRKKDIDCLQPYNWLNDTCIAFYYQYLKELFANDSFYLMDPTVVALLNYEEDPEIIFYGLDLKQFEIIFVPINDNNDKTNANAGTHWSLLVYLCEEDIFIYYDSMKKKSSNIENSKNVAKKLRNLIKGGENSMKVLDNFIINSETPQQKNGYDCGVYVLAITECIIDLLGKKQSIFNNKDMTLLISEEYIDKYRQNIKNILEKLIKK